MLMILLANMLILTHAVVPHHHHNKVFVGIVNVLDYETFIDKMEGKRD